MSATTIMPPLTCTGCGRYGNEEDGIELGGECVYEDCDGTIVGVVQHHFEVVVEMNWEDGQVVSAHINDSNSESWDEGTCYSETTDWFNPYHINGGESIDQAACEALQAILTPKPANDEIAALLARYERWDTKRDALSEAESDGDTPRSSEWEWSDDEGTELAHLLADAVKALVVK